MQADQAMQPDAIEYEQQTDAFIDKLLENNLKMKAANRNSIKEEIIKDNTLTLSTSLKSIPDEIGNLTKLKELYIDDSPNLKQLPKTIWNLKSLQIINIKRTSITTLPSEFGDLFNLKTISLIANHIDNLPKEFANLNNLTTLTLALNKLENFPNEITELKSLKRLDISNNILHEIPIEIKKLSELVELYLDDNQIIKLPEEISELKHLKLLDVSNNMLRDLPEELRSRKDINLSTANNPIEDDEYANFIKSIAKEYGLDTAQNELQSKATNKNNSLIYPECLNKPFYRIIPNPIAYRNKLAFTASISEHLDLPKGVYAENISCSPWLQNIAYFDTVPDQGFKIHVSAKPETALKIAKIVLPILKESNVAYKIMFDLPYMRTTFYLDQYINPSHIIGKNRGTQTGKFITIYAKDPQNAHDVMQKLDEAFKREELSPSDFEKIIGDAQVGESGGIFVRYGLFVGGIPLRPLTPDNQPFNKDLMKKYKIPTKLNDERVYPWPNYMNIKEVWKESDSPFGILNVTWTNPNNPRQTITWTKRPDCWEALAGKQCVVSK